LEKEENFHPQSPSPQLSSLNQTATTSTTIIIIIIILMSGSLINALVESREDLS
jgi:hypothetical protein